MSTNFARVREQLEHARSMNVEGALKAVWRELDGFDKSNYLIPYTKAKDAAATLDRELDAFLKLIDRRQKEETR